VRDNIPILLVDEAVTEPSWPPADTPFDVLGGKLARAAGDKVSVPRQVSVSKRTHHLGPGM